jgi:hypothetical protein
MRISYNNYLDSLAASSLTVTSVVSGYPVTNIQDQRLGMTVRSTELSTFSIIIHADDYISAGKDPVSMFAIVNHNFTSSATITLSRNYINSWPGATSLTFTYNEGIIVSYFSETSAYIVMEDGSRLITESGDPIIESLDYRYYKLGASDTGNTDAFIEIGRVWFGDYLTISPSSLLDFKVTKKRSDIVIYGKDRQKFGLEGVGWRAFSFSFPVSDHTMAASIVEMYKTAGNHMSMIFSNFDTLRGYDLVEPCYVSIVGDLVFQHHQRMKFSYSLELEEDL